MSPNLWSSEAFSVYFFPRARPLIQGQKGLFTSDTNLSPLQCYWQGWHVGAILK